MSVDDLRNEVINYGCDYEVFVLTFLLFLYSPIAALQAKEVAEQWVGLL